MENSKNPFMDSLTNYWYKCIDYPDSPDCERREFSDSICKTWTVWGKMENNGAGWLFLATPDKLTKEKDELHDKTDKLLRISG